MELTVLSNSPANNELERALINGYIEMSEINLLISRENFHVESEAYRVSVIENQQYYAACNDSKDGE